jgi:hypothetical protein
VPRHRDEEAVVTSLGLHVPMPGLLGSQTHASRGEGKDRASRNMLVTSVGLSLRTEIRSLGRNAGVNAVLDKR